jgi:hypothetical protein
MGAWGEAAGNGTQSRRRESEMSSDDLEKMPEWEDSKKKTRN